MPHADQVQQEGKKQLPEDATPASSAVKGAEEKSVEQLEQELKKLEDEYADYEDEGYGNDYSEDMGTTMPIKIAAAEQVC